MSSRLSSSACLALNTERILTDSNPYPIIAFAAPLLTTLPALEVQLWQSNPSASA